LQTYRVELCEEGRLQLHLEIVEEQRA